MRIRQRKSFPPQSRYVKQDSSTGEYELRVPSVCVNWPQGFRERLIRDWMPCTSIVNYSRALDYARHMQHPFTVNKDRVYFKIGVTDVSKRNSVNVVTFLYSTKMQLLVLMDNQIPVFRMLVVYSFLYDKRIGGLPELRTLKYSQATDKWFSHRLLHDL